MSERILIVEDETDLLRTLEYNFTQAGFDTVTTTNGREAIRLVSQKPEPDLVVLDLMLPGISGYDVCKTLRDRESTRKIPIIMLTARGESLDQEMGFDAGADDYVTKPFSMRELLLRVKALMRRAQVVSLPSAAVEDLCFGPLTVDQTAHQVWVNGQEVQLTYMEFKLLVAFLENRGRLLTRDFLLDEVWGLSAAVQTRTIDTHVKRLRQKLSDAGQYIETLRGAGYRFLKELHHD
ncbi:two component transcriptional regulator, winged helix family [Magnetococcus marinus MC-1]|uniref:Two component transcriptional regulator, winged helix family n=1 Tax=Magnetococcus marinus (strain ATCC BAA-1437 / JCM 17883 / MC-1) TaxID=156889 RepID=A0L8V8_MAGMM|nr:response regulator transcription factor [Magnetococcus marinus]ABK44401.1 two component transcriptional regulator, winged helix family [Magnetococcus marinus MC-1]